MTVAFTWLFTAALIVVLHAHYTDAHGALAHEPSHLQTHVPSHCESIFRSLENDSHGSFPTGVWDVSAIRSSARPTLSPTSASDLPHAPIRVPMPNPPNFPPSQVVEVTPKEFWRWLLLPWLSRQSTEQTWRGTPYQRRRNPKCSGDLLSQGAREETSATQANTPRACSLLRGFGCSKQRVET